MGASVAVMLSFAALIFVIALANHAVRYPWYRWLLYAGLGMMGVFMIAVGFGTRPYAGSDPIVTALSVGMGVLMWIWLLPQVRRALAPLFTRRFDPDSPVHTLAPALLLLAIWQQVVDISRAGGVTGLVSELEAEGMVTLVALNTLALTAASLVGVGMWMRRGPAEALKRLGLGIPDFEGLLTATVTAFAVLAVEYMALAAWALVDPAGASRQSSDVDALLGAVGSWHEALIVAAGAAIGEEVLYRGALQPIFGLWATSVFFALSHVQYGFGPALLVVFGIALAFGWLRERFNTTAAVIGHFVYDLAVIAASMLAR